ncbi:solute carrier family 23 member 1-like [Littorina saxatilis]|uniref:solute carrier family 23 member 1-like n=1 Tax=Littorina saxatilis TaxID=31220 RepID=UPI0038B49EE9
MEKDENIPMELTVNLPYQPQRAPEHTESDMKCADNDCLTDTYVTVDESRPVRKQADGGYTAMLKEPRRSENQTEGGPIITENSNEHKNEQMKNSRAECDASQQNKVESSKQTNGGDAENRETVKETSSGQTGKEENGSAENGDNVIELEHVRVQRLIYKVSETPPVHLVFLFALQQGLLPVSAALSVSVLVTDLVCGRDDGEFKTQILSATFLMIGLSTFTMSTIGVRLPVFQGPSSPYIIPLFALATLPEWRCPSQEDLGKYYSNRTMNATEVIEGTLPMPREIIFSKVQQLSGSLMVAGGLHCLIGLTGLVGFLLRFIGPVTIVPAVTLVGLYIYKITVRFSETYWPVAILVAVCGIVLSLYLSKRSSPIPAWNRERGFHIKWYPIHQVFAILISIIIGWSVSAVLTKLDVLSADRDSVQFYARTDTQLHVIHSTPWFSTIYPGQYGFPRFHPGVFLSFFLATILSVLDSIGDYSACARMCYVPQPPAWAVNRGIAVEGLMSLLSGGFGIGHATVSYGGNIGAIGLTRVASRRVFQCVGLMYVVLAIFSKIGAVFITVPYSVLGGTQIITVGIFIGIVLSNLQYIDLGSTRNVAIIGISLLLGLMVPYWVTKTPDPIQSGNEEADNMVKILLSNPVFVGGFLACFLDNTVPGTLKERGISVQSSQDELVQCEDDKTKSDKTSRQDEQEDEFEEGMEVYELTWLPDCVKKSSVAKVLRIFPGKSAPAVDKDITELIYRENNDSNVSSGNH